MKPKLAVVLFSDVEAALKACGEDIAAQLGPDFKVIHPNNLFIQ
jgi:hypothetical protein